MTDKELMQQALEALDWAADCIEPRKPHNCDCPICVASDALRERLAQPQQPQRTHWEGCEEVHPECKRPDGEMKIGVVPEQEPVATVESKTGNPDILMSWWHEPALPVGTKLYTTPPRREWVGLTDEDLVECDEAEYKAARYWEAKLRKKNV